MKNGTWTPMHFARFSAVKQYDNHRLFSKENGLDPCDMVSRTEFVRLLMESGTVDPFQFTQNFIKKQTEEARNNNTNKRKSHDYKDKGKKMEELDNDVDRFPICRGYHELDLNDPVVKADIEETRRRVLPTAIIWKRRRMRRRKRTRTLGKLPNFLTVIPIEGLGQHMSALEYRTILKYRLMIPLFPVDEPCPVCRKVCLDSFGEHAVHCKELPGFKYRHDLVRDVMYDVLKRAGISSKKKAPVNFLTDPLEERSTLRPANILVFGWAGGKHACVDLTGVSPFVGLRDNGFVAGQAALKTELSKVVKHEKACLENQHVFIPFAFDTFGFLAPEAEEFFTRVQRVVQRLRFDFRFNIEDEDEYVVWAVKMN
ncbi:hypothetical protein Tco_0801897 [Tanacetum coccineum]|uniref:Reverse transcriptase domain-containing protein n=1 Tax=Tanacetum coccineum TaxID=301880 RepID=A0ABQ4ZXA5_9ASTR